MSFLKNLAASFMEGASRDADRKRSYAQKILATKGDQLTDVQRQKIEAHAYTDAPERLKAMSENLRPSDD